MIYFHFDVPLNIFSRIEDLVGYSQLERLNLSWNNLKSVTRFAEENLLVARLVSLDLSNNNIQVLHPLGKSLTF